MILLTGYEPFGDFESNPSGDVARELDGTDVDGHRVRGVVLPVEFDRAATVVRSFIDDLGPAAVVSTGLAGGRAAVSLERVGINVDDSVSTPDNAEAEPENEPVVHDGPPAYFSTLPVEDAIDRLLDDGIPARLSNSAGTHLCNDVLYSTRHYVEENDLDVRSGFVHLPLTPGEAIRQAVEPGRGGTVPASMPLEMQVDALKTVLETTVDALDGRV